MSLKVPPPSFVANHETHMVYEFNCHLAHQGAKLLAADWHVVPGRAQYGVGDLVHRLEGGTVLVTEVKHLHSFTGHTARVSRTKARRKVVEQALQYAQAWREQHPEESDVRAAIYTTDGFKVLE